MVKLFKNIFNNEHKKHAIKTAPEETKDTLTHTTSDNETMSEKKPKHGEDGVCCGGCS